MCHCVGCGVMCSFIRFNDVEPDGVWSVNDSCLFTLVSFLLLWKCPYYLLQCWQHKHLLDSRYASRKLAGAHCFYQQEHNTQTRS